MADRGPAGHRASGPTRGFPAPRRRELRASEFLRDGGGERAESGMGVSGCAPLSPPPLAHRDCAGGGGGGALVFVYLAPRPRGVGGVCVEER